MFCRPVMFTRSRPNSCITFVRFQLKLSELRERLATELAYNPFRSLAETAMGAIQLQWGWAALLVGAGMVTWAGWQARQSAKAE